jgi:hypothetical protein
MVDRDLEHVEMVEIGARPFVDGGPIADAHGRAGPAVPHAPILSRRIARRPGEV